MEPTETPETWECSKATCYERCVRSTVGVGSREDSGFRCTWAIFGYKDDPKDFVEVQIEGRKDYELVDDLCGGGRDLGDRGGIVDLIGPMKFAGQPTSDGKGKEKEWFGPLKPMCADSNLMGSRRLIGPSNVVPVDRVCEKGVKVISGSDQIVVNELDQKISELGKVSSRGRGGRWKRLASRGSGNGGVAPEMTAMRWKRVVDKVLGDQQLGQNASSDSGYAGKKHKISAQGVGNNSRILAAKSLPANWKQ
ncbi:hypothetical protein Q3G72_026324 [Acer saccharum]|nr:hypothetical protein Q3G72_026324 [Acer saccharum]